MTQNKQKSRLVIASSPHLKSPIKTSHIMLDVLIALVPVILATTLIFGTRVILNIFVAVFFAVLTEYIARKIMKRPQTIQDLSAAVTGVLLALNVPVEMPLWQLALGSIFAISLVKQAFGGIGQNLVNPAMITRLVLVSSFSSSFTNPSVPIQSFVNFAHSTGLSGITPDAAVDGTSSATFLYVLKEGISADESVPNIFDLLIGNQRSTAVGEVCSLAFVLAFIYLLARKVITWHAPISFVGTVTICSFLYGSLDFRYVILQLLSGGLLFAAIFMATDYTTTPLTNKGKLIFGIGCGLITCLIRFWGSLPEGVSYSIIIMNILTPHIDRFTIDEPLG
ncbi:MAG: RnfABCDGE type electron transport complex subunit D, partial [Clostridiaceae bacterium]|nr:RnfABCDGE type electron transport complex subunit D [Clostridiaceae bacterium]